MSKKPTDSQDAHRILQKARDLAIKARRELVKRKEILPSGEFADVLGISLEDLNKKIAAHRLFALKIGDENYFPAFYLHRAADRKKFERACKALGDINGWRKWQFFTTPKGSLADKTPLHALENEDSLEAVIASAFGFAER